MLLLVSDDADFAPLVERCSALGLGTVAVCEQRSAYPGADVTLDWRALQAGEVSMEAGGVATSSGGGSAGMVAFTDGDDESGFDDGWDDEDDR